MILTMLFLVLGFKASAQELDQVINLRSQVETLSAEVEELKNNLKQEEAVYSGRYQDLKNQILREKLRKVQLEQQQDQFRAQRIVKSGTTVGQSKLLQQLQTQFDKSLQVLQKRVSSSPSWNKDLAELRDLWADGQADLYQVKLIQFLERRLHESMQIKKTFQTLSEGEAKTIEVLQLGYLMSMARQEKKTYFQTPGGKWEELKGDGAQKAVQTLFNDFRLRQLQFVSLSQFPEFIVSGGAYVTR